MRWTVGHKISAGFLLVTLLLLAISLALCFKLPGPLQAAQSGEGALWVMGQLGELEAELTDADALRQRYLLSGGLDDLQYYQRQLVQTDAVLSRLAGMSEGDTAQARQLALLRQAVEAHVAAMQRTIDARANPEHVALLQGAPVLDTQAVRRAIGTLKADLQQQERNRNAVTVREVQATQLAAALGLLLTAGLAAAVAYWLIRNITGPLQLLTAMAQRAAAGDMSQVPDIGPRRDEFGQLIDALVEMGGALRQKAATASAISRGELGVRPTLLSAEDELGLAFIAMVQNLQGTLANLQAGSLIMSEVASTVSVDTEQVVGAANETASAAQELATVVDELRHTTEQTTQSMEDISAGTRASAEATQQGEAAVRDVSHSMGEVQRRMGELAQRTLQLTEKSLAIGEIIGAVDDLAEQSSILAVNASLEAAHAQEHGRGFAVVAGEIRDLAGKSKQAVQHIRGNLFDIQRLISGLVEAAEQSSLSVRQGVSRSEVAGEALAHISGIVETNLGVAKWVAAQALKQASGVGRIATAVKQIRVATGDNLLSMQHIKLATNELELASHRLQGQIAVFRV